jgi:Ca-activated chloride channel family protein
MARALPRRGLLGALLVVGTVALGTAGATLADEETGGLTLEQRIALHRQERATVRLVQVPVAVTTRRGRPVTGLEREDFALYEDSRPQEIRYFAAEDAGPISIAFLLDLSGSMAQQNKLGEAQEAIRYFLSALAPEDRFALVGFADQQVAMITEFTSDRARFLERLAVQRAWGPTALYDALAETPQLVDDQVEGRRAIVLFTDGVDNASSLDSFTARLMARRVSVPIYSIGFTSLSRRTLGPGHRDSILRMLELFSLETGGVLFSVFDPDDLKDAVLQIEDELRSRYVIGYYPSETEWDGSFHRIRVELVERDLRVRTRTGYYAEP